MNDLEKEFNVMELVTPYEEIVNDGNIYYNHEDIETFNVSMMCYSKKGVIVTGNVGTGKTTLVRRFVQQNLSKIFGVESIKVIKLFEEFLLKCKSEEEVVTLLYELCKKYENTSIILYLICSNENSLRTITRIFERYAEAISKKCKNCILKAILEYTTTCQEEREKLNTISNVFDVFYMYMPSKDEKKLKLIEAMTAIMSKQYNISITSKTIFYGLVVIDGYYKGKANLNTLYTEFERFFVIAKKQKKKFVTEGIIKKVYDEFFKRIYNTPSETLLQTAYHEAGHTLFVLLMSDFFKMQYVTIIPGIDYCGLTVSSAVEEGIQLKQNREFAINLIAKSLAGRESEKIFTQSNDINTGANGDLKKADEVVYKMICKSGDSKALGTNCIMSDEKLISETTKSKIEHEKWEIIQEATFLAFKKITEHKKFVEQLAKQLSKQLLVSGAEVRKMWDEYLAEIK